jgi:hypothetical protein
MFVMPAPLFHVIEVPEKIHLTAIIPDRISELVIQLRTEVTRGGSLMTNIAKAIDRLREEHRDAKNQVQKLGEAISVLEQLTRSSGSTGHAGAGNRSKRVLSAAGRRRISLAQKARWAKIRQTKKAA